MNSFTVTAVWLRLCVLSFQATVCFFVCVYKLGIVVLSQEARDEFVAMLLHGRQVTRMFKDTRFAPCWYSCVYLKFDKWINNVVLVILAYIITEFLTSQLWLGNIHLPWDVIINMIMLGGLICSLKSFLQLNMCQELQIFAVVYMYSGCKLSLGRLCGSDFGITPVDDITIGIICAAFCFHIEHIIIIIIITFNTTHVLSGY